MAGLPKKGTVHRPFQECYVGSGAFDAPFHKFGSAYQRADNIRPYGIERTQLRSVGAIINRPAVMGCVSTLGFGEFGVRPVRTVREAGPYKTAVCGNPHTAVLGL